MRQSDRSLTPAEQAIIDTVWANDGADLAGATVYNRGWISSPIAKRMARDGLLTIDAGARAFLTEAGLGYVRHTSPPQ